MQTALSPNLLFALLVIIFVLLIVEVIVHNRRLKSIPLRISVSGTRGKTTVTRLLASILRESGKRVLAKTTGTEAIYILPDGSEEAINRVGAVNILEQKKLIKKANNLKVDCLVSEVMSIHPENHAVESQKLLKPDYTIITNLRPDHLDGVSEKEMWKVYSNDINQGSTILMPEDEINDNLKGVIDEKMARLITIDSSAVFSQNRHLVRKLASILGISKEQIATGLEKVHLDKGETTGFRFINASCEIVFINSFAANDPLSSTMIVNEIVKQERWKSYNTIGLLSLRNDRGERSKQWLDFLKDDGDIKFDHIFCHGSHAESFSRKLKICDKIKSSDPKEITNIILDYCEKSCLVFGLANIVGMGLSLQEYWGIVGERINIQQ